MIYLLKVAKEVFVVARGWVQLKELKSVCVIIKNGTLFIKEKLWWVKILERQCIQCIVIIAERNGKHLLNTQKN